MWAGDWFDVGLLSRCGFFPRFNQFCHTPPEPTRTDCRLYGRAALRGLPVFCRRRQRGVMRGVVGGDARTSQGLRWSARPGVPVRNCYHHVFKCLSKLERLVTDVADVAGLAPVGLMQGTDTAA